MLNYQVGTSACAGWSNIYIIDIGWCLQKYTLIRYAHVMRPRIEVSDSVQEARDAIDGMVLELTDSDLQWAI